MMTATAEALHAIVADVYRRAPGTMLRAACPVCHARGTVTHAAIEPGDDIDACRCEACGAEWLDRRVPEER
jgi:hypothetical protein